MENFDSYIGRVFGERYTVINTIGAGENSVVFGAYDTVENRTVALKILRPEFNDDPVISERFATEAELMSLLSHPNIIKIYDTCLDGECRYFVMEYIEGITLKKHILGQGALPVEEILFLSRQILSALSAIHEKGIVHSDIKPQNVVVLPDGHIYLMDFGISKRHTEVKPRTFSEDDPTFGGLFTDDPVSEEDSPSDLAVGTVHYVSPEQAEGRDIDHQSDLYSFGVMLYEMATGILPFFGESAHKIALMHVRLQPIPPTHLDASIPEGLERIILRAMEKLPIARYSSATEMQRDLDELAHQLRMPKKAEEPRELTPWQSAKETALEYLNNFSITSFITGTLCALLVCVVLGLGILSGALLAEQNNPRHVKIPDLKGKEVISAIDALDEDVYDIRITYVDDDKSQDRIIAQSPAGGKVKKLSRGEKCAVYVTVTRRTLPPVMPDLRYLSYAETAELLKAYDCTVTVVERPHLLFPAGTVLATSPEAGSPTAHDITLYVSTQQP